MTPKKAVHVPTQEAYDTLMRAFEKRGWKWRGGQKPTSFNAWNEYREATCVDFHDQCGFADTDFQKRSGYQIITLEEALKELHMPQYKRGDRVLVRHYESSDWEERIYLTAIEGALVPYICVDQFDEKEFMNGDAFDTCNWKHISPLQPAEQAKTVDDVLSKLSPEDKEIIKKALK